MQQELVLENADQVSALAHPLRVRILHLLFDEPHTNQQLAEQLGESPARLHFHVKELAKNGLIELVEQRPKGGVLEKYYLSVARRFRLAPELAGQARSQGMHEITWEVARQDLMRALDYYGDSPPELQTGQFRVKLAPERLARVREHLMAIATEVREAESNATDLQTGTMIGLTYFIHAMPDAGASQGADQQTTAT
jgi:DNA-binding transcriptional ArsR family regulator